MNRKNTYFVTRMITKSKKQWFGLIQLLLMYLFEMGYNYQNQQKQEFTKKVKFTFFKKLNKYKLENSNKQHNITLKYKRNLRTLVR